MGTWAAGWAECLRRWSAPRADAIVALLALVALAEVSVRAAIAGTDAESALAIALLALGGTVPLALLDKVAAAVVTCASGVLSLAGFHVLSAAAFAAALVALYRLGRDPSRHLRLHLPAVGLAVPFLVLAFIGPNPSASESAALTVLTATLAPLAVLSGLTVRAWHEAEENRAARQVIADTLLEHTARSERVRIARELHDIVAHHISMIAVQAEAARLAVPGLPAAGARRLSAIGDTARDALVEMRRLLGVLRDEARTEVAELRPQPGLGQLTDLIDEARNASGRATRLIFRGVPIALEPNVELAAYRIVQEALTNTRRHAPGAAVDVELAYADAQLRLRVRDNGPGLDPAAQSPGGHGVMGMRERAAAVGGLLRAGEAAGGGYLVEARLPVKIEEPT